MEFLQSSLRRHFVGKPVVASGAKCQLFSKASFEDISHFLFGFFIRLVQDVGKGKL